jgi:hypothetical protein
MDAELPFERRTAAERRSRRAWGSLQQLSRQNLAALVCI